MDIKIVKNPINKSELLEMASQQFGDFVKAVVDVEQGIMALGAELHADLEVLLMEKESSKRANTWGVNLYPGKTAEEWIEFDSMVNIKPAYGNRSRNVHDPEVREKIKQIVRRLVFD